MIPLGVSNGSFLVPNLNTSIPLAVEQLKLRWPDAKTFGALARYLPDVAEEYDSKDRRQQEEEAHRMASLQDLIDQWQSRWDALAADEHETIRAAVVRQSPFLVKRPDMLERCCYWELAGRQEEAQTPTLNSR